MSGRIRDPADEPSASPKVRAPGQLTGEPSAGMVDPDQHPSPGRIARELAATSAGQWTVHQRQIVIDVSSISA
jgi:hypothetical protein